MAWQIPQQFRQLQGNYVPAMQQGQATLQSLLGGGGVAGYRPAPRMMGDVYDAVWQAYQNNPSIDLSQFNAAYTNPALQGQNAQSYAAALRFLVNIANQSGQMPQQLMGQLTPNAPSADIANARGAAITNLADRFSSNPAWQGAASNWTKGMGNLNAMPTNMWQQALSPYMALAELLPAQANALNQYVNIPTSPAGYSPNAQSILQALAQGSAGVQGEWVGPQGVQEMPSLQILRALNRAAGVGEETFGTAGTKTGSVATTTNATASPNAEGHFRNYMKIAATEYRNNPAGFKANMLAPQEKQTMISNLGSGATGTANYRKLLAYIDKVIATQRATGMPDWNQPL